jgi:hypothetical protein
MKSLHCSSVLKTALLIVPLALCFGGSTVLQAGGKDRLSPGPVRPGNLDYRTELPPGYLKVYTATEEFNDGGLPYHAHSSYTIYTTDGKVFKNVENHISRSDEIPEVVLCQLHLTWLKLDRKKTDTFACPLSSEREVGD